jgi:hypothetical protein
MMWWCNKRQFLQALTSPCEAAIAVYQANRIAAFVTLAVPTLMIASTINWLANKLAPTEMLH